MARIMIVEDESIVALDIRRHVEKAGHAVMAVFASGETAVEKFEAFEPDLVLMDIRLQGEMDGVEASRIIKQRYGVPVILLTAYADDHTVRRAIETEPFGYIIKPFEDRELRTTIEMALFRYGLERKLQASEERYRRFFEDDLSGAFVAGSDGTITECNPAFAMMFAFPTVDDAAGHSVADLFPTSGEYETVWGRLLESGKLSLAELRMVRRDGRNVSVLANIVTTPAEGGGSPNEIKGYLIDTTERIELEGQLRQAQKMEAIGRLAGGIAHDFNNILTVIMGYSAMLLERFESEAGEKPNANAISRDETGGEIRGIQQAARKASTLTRQLLAFSRKQVLKPTGVDVNVLITEMERMIRRLIRDDIKVRLTTGAAKPMVYVDPGQLEQVIMNLVVNARDAMPTGGSLTIETLDTQIEKQRSVASGSIEPGDYLMIRVSDTGTGMTQEVLARIFDPFFTTKPIEKGTGLGLATVYGIVRQSGGHIDVESQPGRGSTFKICLPKSEAAHDDSGEAVRKRHQIRGGTETILLVEDEEPLRKLIEEILSQLGYTVLSASNAGEAILIAEKEDRSIDIAVTDLIMPHMDGVSLIDRLQTLRPGIRGLLLSGYPDTVVEERGIGGWDGAFLAKPFEPQVLAETVRSVLDSDR
jgi:two-component system, cell cycle sensor histidine kinase and response regulator CckA